MAYRIEQDNSRRESFGEYKYRIYKNDKFVASYWHDYRGDEHGIQFVNGKSDFSFAGRMVDFIEGGGAKPLTLTGRAVKYLDEKLAEYKIARS